MIDLSSLMPPTPLLGSKQHYSSFALKGLDFLFASQVQFLAVYSLVYMHTQSSFLCRKKVLKWRCWNNFCSLFHRYFCGMVFSKAKPEGLITTTTTTSEWNAASPFFSFTENYLWSILSNACYLLPLLIKGMTGRLSETAMICQGITTTDSEEQ